MSCATRRTWSRCCRARTSPAPATATSPARCSASPASRVVGSGFVYVRGLGDRYSLALLNGSPLPSPEPLRRVVPLDIFPTSLIASSLVQKSYSVNYPGEFGGGVINLTTTSIPDETFLTIGGSAELDSETTGHFGYSYYGSDLDPSGFDDGTRDLPAGLRSAVAGGAFNGETTAAQRRDFAAALTNAPTTLLQRVPNIAPNLGGNLSAGTAFDLGGARIGDPRRGRLQQQLADARLRSSKSRSIRSLPVRRSRASGGSPPTTESSSTACSASAPRSASTS